MTQGPPVGQAGVGTWSSRGALDARLSSTASLGPGVGLASLLAVVEFIKVVKGETGGVVRCGAVHIRLLGNNNASMSTSASTSILKASEAKKKSGSGVLGVRCTAVTAEVGWQVLASSSTVVILW